MRTKMITSFVLLSALAVWVPSCCTPNKIGSVGLSLVPQHTDCWCWAACTEMISEYYGHKVIQCDSSNYVHGTPPDCCGNCNDACPCWIDWPESWGATIGQIKNNWTHWNFDYTYIDANLPWHDDDEDDVRDTISTKPFCKKSPLFVVWWWRYGGGHAVAAYGYAEIAGEKYVSYLNPWPPDCERNEEGDECYPVSGGEDEVMTYDAFVDDGLHSWKDTFYDFKYTGT
jgi:hypothetical protein